MIFAAVSRVVRDLVCEDAVEDYRLGFRLFGVDGVRTWAEPPAHMPREVFVMGECIAPTPERAEEGEEQLVGFIQSVFALEKLGLWTEIQPRLAQSESVRAALALVARGEASLGIVYETDAKAEPRVKVVATFPEDAHPPIIYPFALTANAKGEGPARFLAYLQAGAARTVFSSQGFTVLPPARTTQ